jgi:hypothetical protein
MEANSIITEGAERCLTRRGIVALAKDELGLPLSKGRLDKLSMLGRGPKAIGEFGGRHIYDREVVLEWLRSLIRPLEQRAAE